jgi:glycine/D-amino acid oxidase-like deaminating enzyme
MGDLQADVIVIGAGLTAWGASLELAAGGHRVVVLEGETRAPGASDLGHLPVGLGVPYLHAVQRLGRERALEVWETHRECLQRLRELLPGLAAPGAYRQAGGFLLAEDRAEATALADSEDLLREDGFPGEFLDHYMLEARFSVAGFAGAYWAADEGEVDGPRLLQALAGVARDKGVVVPEGSPLLELELTGAGADAVTVRGRFRASWAVLAVESGIARLLPSLQGRVVAEEGEALALTTEPGAALPSPARAAGGGWAWRQLEDRVHLACFGPPGAATDERVLAKRLRARPVSSPRVRVTRDASPDGLPRIGLLPGLPVLIAAGYGGLGYGYALPAARWIAETVRTGRDPAPPAYRADRS